MGFPTANLETDAELLPARGVYACRVRADGSEWLPAVANLGTRPTFDGRGFLVEVHILDFSGDLYGAEMEVAFSGRLRGEQTFDGLESLRSQIEQDVLDARAVLEESL
jgi:riboflavin kinase/FMN adenylyltransferase